jgi:probable F420-dependent oxidoreductase
VKVDFYLPADAGTIGAPGHAERSLRLGFDGFFTADTGHEPFLPIAAAATRAPGLEYGTSIAVAFPRSPMVTAQMAWDLQAATGGRFILGLGTQVRGHIVRRFSTEWGSPGPRLAEYIAALRAIWRTFREDVPLRFDGDFYAFSLMTPFFNPGPIDHPDPQVFISAVGPYNCRLVGEVCDGIHVHPFHTVAYLERHVVPLVEEGARSVGRSTEDVCFASTVMCVTGTDDESMERSKQAMREQIAFYASTPAYRGVLEVEGWDFGPELSAMARRQRWSEMSTLITDEVLERVAVVAPVDELGAAVRARYGGLLDRVGYYTLAGALDDLPDEDWATLIAATRG